MTSTRRKFIMYTLSVNLSALRHLKIGFFKTDECRGCSRVLGPNNAEVGNDIRILSKK